MMNCPSCGATVQSDASFCGQCGFNLKTVTTPAMMSEPSEPQVNPIVPDPLVPPDPLIVSVEPPTVGSPAPVEPPTIAPPTPIAATQLQLSSARLLHLQTNVEIELSPGLPVIHIGKPNDRIPPDIDVSGFPNSDIVSRIHQ
jgi:zinc-ribbon domain